MQLFEAMKPTMPMLCVLFQFFLPAILKVQAQEPFTGHLPDSIHSGKQGPFHVQGVAIDQSNGFVYFSFTDKLVKTDLSRKLIGSVTGFLGHLGDLDFDPRTGMIYASLEYKNDAIGKGISTTLGVENKGNTGFYIALIEGSRVTHPDMDAEKEDLLRTVYIKEAANDYQSMVTEGNRKVMHRFGCSGIDGLTLGPATGKSKDKKLYLYVAYGIYSDTTRSDNDHQIILKYDITNWNQYAQKLSQETLHHSGPEKPLEKYFINTGNTSYGIQNLAYDFYTGNFYAAVYPGNKSQYPNYSLFVIDGHQKAKTAYLIADNKRQKIKTLALLPANDNTAQKGWHFKWGATGLCPLGNGFFYISHNKKAADGQQETTLHKYKWTGSRKEAFTLAGQE